MACSKEEISQSESELISLEQLENYGEIHNQFLTNINKNFEIDESIQNLDYALDYVDKFQQSFLEKVDLKGINKVKLSSALSESKDLVIYDLTYEKLFIPANLRTLDSEEPTLFELVEQANEAGLLDDFEHKHLIELADKVKASYEGLVSGSELRGFVSDLKNRWAAQGYTTRTQGGQVIAFALTIASSSLNWWEANPEAGLEGTNGRVLALPAWAAADIRGAIWGGATGAIASYTTGGEVAWEAVGIGALSGAISTSTGGAGKLGRWLVALVK